MTDNSRFWSKTPWRPLPDIVHAVCIRHFDASGTDDLTLQLGDEVYITEVNGKDNQWCRGWLLAHPSVVTGLTGNPGQSLRPRAYAGIFPRCCVSVREVLADPDKAKATQKARGHARNASAPSAPYANGDIFHSRSPSNPENRPLRSSPLTNGFFGSPARTPSNSDNRPPRSTPSPPKRQDSPLAPLVPRDVQPRAHGEPKEPAPLPALRIGDGGMTEGEPLVDDISSTIREWHSARLHNLALRREYKKLDELSALVDRLSDARRQLAHNLLTEQETRKLREQVVWDLVKGNKMVDGEVIVRSAPQGGRTLTAYDSMTEMADLQTVMSLRDRPIASTNKEAHLSHLLMQVKAVPQELRDPALLHMCLYSVSSSGRPKPVSEAFAVELAIEEGTGRVEIADRYNSTLFAELNKADVGGGDQSDSRLYLICRLIHDEPMHKAKIATSAMPNSPTPQTGDSEDTSNRGRINFSRTRSRRSSDANDKARPSTGASMRSALQRSSSHNRVGTASSTAASSDRPDSARKTRRVAGWCAISVSSLIRDRASECLTMSFWMPSPPLEGVAAPPASGEDGWNDVIKSMTRSPSGNFVKSPMVGSLVLDLAAYAHDDVNLLMRDRPALLREVHCTPALSLNGAAKQPRSDIYLTLREPILPGKARSFHPQHGSVPINAETDLTNLQITLEVRTNDGQRIDDAIHPTANRRPHTAFRSPAIERGEAWYQTIRLSISPKDLPNAHIIMSIADGANFPFALAWVPLWDRVNGFPPDGPQSLALWDYCEFTANLIDGRGAYQSLPARVDEMKEQVGPQMASIAIETHLSSTSATQNADVLALSNLDRISLEDTAVLLDRFPSIPDEEIGKFLGPILMSLDYVLGQCSDYVSEDTAGPDQRMNRELSELAVRCLVHAVRLIRDRRFPHLEGLLDDYVSRRKPSVEARLSILRSLRTLLSKPFDARGGRELRASLKVTDILLKFALRCEQRDDPLENLRPEAIEFLEDVVVLLSNTSHLALPSQVIIVQNFHTWVPEILPICSGQDALRFTAAAADACARNHSPLWLHRLSMIHSISGLEAFQQEPLRSAITDMTESWLLPVWPSEPVVDETAISALRLCVTIVKDQQPFMTHVQCQRYIQRLFSAFFMINRSSESDVSPSAAKTKAIAARRRAFSPLFPTSHPFRTVSTTSEFVPSEILLEIASVLGTFFQDDATAAPLVIGAAPHYSSAEQIDELSEADLAESLTVIRALQASAAFPPSWLSLCVSMSRCTVSMLAWVLAHLGSALPNEAEDDGEAILEFDGTLWTLWFQSLITLVTSDVVRMEEHSEQKRRAVWTIGGDIRESAANLLKRAWDNLGWLNDEHTEAMYGIVRMGGYQVQFTSQLIPSIVSLGLSLHLGLRMVAVEILKSMIVGEWELSGDLDVVRSALTDALDNAFRDEKFEPSQARILLETLREHLDYLASTGAVELHSAIARMLMEIQMLVEMLVRVRDAAGDHDTQLEHRVKLLAHLEMTNNEDSYLRHIHDVAETQVENHNYSAASLAMQLHVDLLKQRATPDADVQLAKAYPELQLPSQTLYQRRQMLYAAMVKYFKLGCCWSKVLSTLELQRQELLESYDTANLAVVLREQADTYHKLSSGKGLSMPRYFKVNFSNHLGFPASVMGKMFVFEAPSEDDTARFAKRLKQTYPSATVIHSGITSSTTANDTPKISILSINVNRDQLNPINQRIGVSPFFRHHHLSSEPDTFSNSTRQQKPGVPVAEQTVAKTIYITRQKFPTILGRSEIIKEEAVILSPTQAAIDRVHRKTMDLAEMLMSANLTETSENDKLVQTIRSSVDPSSLDSVAAYHELLLEDEGPDSQRTSTSSKQARSASLSHGRSTSHASTSTYSRDDKHARKAHLKALTVALQDHTQMLEHALSSAFDRRLTVKALLRESLEKTFEPELYGLYPDGKWRLHSPAWTDARPPTRPAPPIRGESLFADLAPATGEIPMLHRYEMSGGAGPEEQASSADTHRGLGRADSTAPKAGPADKVSENAGAAGHRRLHSESSMVGRTDHAVGVAGPESRRGSRKGLGAAESDTETETGRRRGMRRRLSSLAKPREE